jgi:hypothetical protein
MRQGHTPRLSIDFLNWASNKQCGDNQDGGFFSDLWKGFAAYGICTEAEMPYQSKLDPKRQPDVEALADAKTRLSLGLRLHWIKEWNVKTGLTDDEFAAIKRTLEQGWPVGSGLRWPKQEQWVGDVLQMCPSNAVRDGHSVLLVGYRDDSSQPGGGVFVFRNTSHGGLDGAMPYAYAREYMNDAVWIDFASRTNTHTAGGGFSVLLRDPLGSLTMLPAGRNRRISSNEQPNWHDANLDMTVLPPGQTLEMPVLQGARHDHSHVVYQSCGTSRRTQRSQFAHLLGWASKTRGSGPPRRVFCRRPGQTGRCGQRAGAGFAFGGADLLLADAFREVRAHRRVQRQSRSNHRLVLAGGLG